MPNSFKDLVKVRSKLEKHFKDMQDFEFTRKKGKSVHPADAQRQAHRPCSRAYRRRNAARKSA